MDFDPMAVLGTKRTVQCFNCGDKVPAGVATCPRCKVEMPTEDEQEAEESLNLVSGPPTMTGELLGEALTPAGYGQPRKRNIDKLEEAYHGVSDGSIPVDAYRARVGDVYKMLNAAVQLSKTDVMEERIKGLDNDPSEKLRETADLARQSQPLLAEYLRGVVKMREYPNTLNLDDARAGLEIAKAAVDQLTVIKERCDELGAQIDAEQKANAPAESQ